MTQEQKARKKAEKAAKKRRITWIVIAIIVVVLVALKLTEVDFSSIKDRFTDENGKISFSSGYDEDNFPFKLDSSDNVTVKEFNDKIEVLTSNTVTIINPSSGEKVYSFTHGFSNPVLKTSGVYSLLYDQGSSKIRLDSTTENIFETTSKENILCACVSTGGTIAYATVSESAKSTIFVYSKSLKQKFTYDVSDGYVSNIAVDSTGKKIAFTSVNSKDGKLLTTVNTINVGNEEVISSFNYQSSSIYELRYLDTSKLFVVADDFVSMIKNQKKEEFLLKQGSVSVLSYEFDTSDKLNLVYEEYKNADKNIYIAYKSNGDVKITATLSGNVADVSSSNDMFSILYIDGKIESYNYKGELVSTTSSFESTNSITQVASKIFIQRHSVLECHGVG